MRWRRGEGRRREGERVEGKEVYRERRIGGEGDGGRVEREGKEKKKQREQVIGKETKWVKGGRKRRVGEGEKKERHVRQSNCTTQTNLPAVNMNSSG